MSSLQRVRDLFEWAKDLGVEARNLSCASGSSGVEMEVQQLDRPFMLWVPEDVLLDAKHVDVPKGKLLPSSELSPDRAAFYSEYLDIVLDPKKMEWKAQLSEAMKAEADIPARFGALGHFFSDTMSDGAARQELAFARTLAYRRDGELGPVFMPIMDFLNHHEKGLPYHRVGSDRGGLKVEGKSIGGGALAFYGHKDPLALLTTYGFFARCNSGFSLNLELKLVDGRTVKISRQLGLLSRVKGAGLVPEYQIDGDTIELKNLCLASVSDTLFPKAAWLHLSKKLNFPQPEVIWGTIRRQNLSLVWALYQRALQIKDEKLRAMVAAMAQLQFQGLIQ